MTPRRSFASPLRWFIAIAACTSLLITGVAWAATPIRLLDRPGVQEKNPAASEGYLAWAEQATKLSGLNVFVKPDGGPRIQMNRRGTVSLFVGMDGTTAVFDVYGHSGRRNANIRMFDVLTQTRSRPPAGVNTRQNEFRPSVSGDWLLFTREGGRRTRIVLFNTSTSEQRVLMNLRATNHLLGSNQISGDWATFASCDLPGYFFSNCQVHLYQISTDTLTQIPNPDRQQWASSVTSDGTVYFVRGRGRDRWVCGGVEKIVRLPYGGSEAVIARIPEGKHVSSTFALEKSDTTTSVLLGREPCPRRSRQRIPRGGIFEIPNADTTT